MIKKLYKRWVQWWARLDRYHQQAKQMRREDRLGEVDYPQPPATDLKRAQPSSNTPKKP
ncbi:MAG: hypothetical protein R3Y10_10995 [Ferrimonas sp.]